MTKSYAWKSCVSWDGGHCLPASDRREIEGDSVTDVVNVIPFTDSYHTLVLQENPQNSSLYLPHKQYAYNYLKWSI
jgi:hypothetical protein